MAIKQFWKCWHLNWILRTLNDNLWKVWVLFGILKHWQWHNFIIYFLIAAIKVFWSLDYSFSLTLSVLELLLSLNLRSWCHYKCLICLLNHPGMCCNRVCWGRIIPSIGRWWFSSRGTGLWWVFFPLVVSIESCGNFFFVHCQVLGWFMLTPPLLTWLASVFMYQSIKSFISHHTSWFVSILLGVLRLVSQSFVSQSLKFFSGEKDRMSACEGLVLSTLS